MPQYNLNRPARVRRLLFIGVATLVVLGLVAPINQTQAQTAQPAQTFTVAVETTPSDMDPASSYDEFSNIVTRAVYEGLVTLNGKALDAFTPLLAESYTNDKDTVYTFKLRQNVTFHDGTAFNAAAVKQSFTRTVTSGLATAGILRTFLTNPNAQIQVVDPMTVAFKFDRPQPFFLYALAASYGTGIVSPKVLGAYPDPTALHNYLQTHDAGTGPYMLADAQLQADKPITLKRYDKYWRGWEGTHFNQVVIQTLSQSGQRRRALENKQADAATSLLPDDILRLQKTGGYLFNTDPTLRIDFLIMGAGYGPLKTVKARQAMSYAFDYAAYNRAELGGLGMRPNGPFPQTLLGSDTGTFSYPTDLKKAKQLLDEAGVAPGTVFKFAAPEGRGDLAGQILKQQLEQLGYFLEIQKYSSDDYYNKLLVGDISPDRPDFMLQAWWPDYNSPVNFILPLFYSKSTGSAGQNAGYYTDTSIDQAIQNGQKASSVDQIVQMFKPVQQTLTKDDPAGIYMAQAPDRTVVSGAIKGVVFNVLYIGTFDFYALSK